MHSIISVLNANEGALMVIITAVYVIATIFICMANIKSARASKDQVNAAKEQTDASKAQLEEMQREHNESKRLEIMPFLDVDFYDIDFYDYNPTNQKTELEMPVLLSLEYLSSNHSANYVKNIAVKNIGLGIAHNIKTTWVAECETTVYSLSATLLKVNEAISIDAIISANFRQNNTEDLPATLRFEFEDLIGNKYYQDLSLVFSISSNSIQLILFQIDIPHFCSSK